MLEAALGWGIASVLAAQTLRIAIPYLLAAVGGSFSERGGVANIALEGLILVGAFACVWATFATGDPWAGVAAALAAGLATASLHGLITITLGGDQIVSGLAINLLAAGATRLGLQLVFGSASNSARIPNVPRWEVPWAARDPLLAALCATPLVTLTLVVLGVSVVVQHRTAFGIHLRAVGDNPWAAEAAGLHVTRLRYAGVLASGALAALGGAWLALNQGMFTDGMSAGRGYIALAALIVGRWHPLGAAGAALLFGAAETLEMHLQGGPVPSAFIQLIPYVATLAVLAGFVGKARPPGALGKPWPAPGS